MKFDIIYLFVARNILHNIVIQMDNFRNTNLTEGEVHKIILGYVYGIPNTIWLTIKYLIAFVPMAQ